MTKQIVTETLLTECPNCGAPRERDEEECGFCGTSLVQQLRVKELNLAGSEPNVVVRDFRDSHVKKADIVSDVIPNSLRSNRSMLATLMAVFFLAVAFWFLSYHVKGVSDYRREKEYLQEFKESHPEVYVIYPSESESLQSAWDKVTVNAMYTVLSLVISVSCFVTVIVPVVRYRRVCRKGTEYYATVLSNTLALENGDDVFTGRGAADSRVKVVTEIDGKETSISIPMPAGRTIKDYPTGKRVKIRVLGRGVVLCEE
ncbi:MAG: hypothetical protein J5645_05300 [Lachnospiraceae bacterium]|nr:hypothetical protein [Lachnospiraceae bacterium]